MTRIGLKWKKSKPTGPVFLEEAAELLGVNYHALRQRVLRMVNDQAADTLPMPKKEETGWQRWYFDRDQFEAFLKAKAKLDEIIKGGQS